MSDLREPPTSDELAAIRRRASRRRELADMGSYGPNVLADEFGCRLAVLDYVADVPVLLAEVDRLTRETRRLGALLALVEQGREEGRRRWRSVPVLAAALAWRDCQTSASLYGAWDAAQTLKAAVDTWRAGQDGPADPPSASVASPTAPDGHTATPEPAAGPSGGEPLTLFQRVLVAQADDDHDEGQRVTDEINANPAEAAALREARTQAHSGQLHPRRLPRHVQDVLNVAQQWRNDVGDQRRLSQTERDLLAAVDEWQAATFAETEDATSTREQNLAVAEVERLTAELDAVETRLNEAVTGYQWREKVERMTAERDANQHHLTDLGDELIRVERERDEARAAHGLLFAELGTQATVEMQLEALAAKLVRPPG